MTNTKVKQRDEEFLKEVESKRSALSKARSMYFEESLLNSEKVDLDWYFLDFNNLISVDLRLGGSFLRIEKNEAIAQSHFVKIIESLERIEQLVISKKVLEASPVEPVQYRSLGWTTVGLFILGKKNYLQRFQAAITRVSLEGLDHWPFGQCFLELAFGTLSDSTKKALDKNSNRLMAGLKAGIPIVNANDETGFQDWLAGRVVEYKNRTRMSTYDEHGCTKFGNSMVIDHFGIALCKLAATRGLKFEIESPYFPLKLLTPLN